MLQYLVLLGAAASLVGVVAYARDTARGETQPNRVTWLLWAIAPLIGSAAAVASGVRWAALPTFMAGFGPLIVLAASFANPKAYWKLGPFDYLCGLCSILALGLWALTNNSTIAIVFAILSDAFAAAPTFVKSWYQPKSESRTAYFGALINQLTVFAAARTGSFSELGFSMYLLAMNLSLLAVLYRRKLFRFVDRRS